MQFSYTYDSNQAKQNDPTACWHQLDPRYQVLHIGDSQDMTTGQAQFRKPDPTQSLVADNPVTRQDRLETLITKLWLLHESVQGQSKSIQSRFVPTKDGSNVVFEKEIIISEATPKIGNNSVMSKQLPKVGRLTQDPKLNKPLPYNPT